MSVLQYKPVRFAAAAAGSALMISAWPAAAHWMAGPQHSAGAGQADALGVGASAAGQPAVPAGASARLGPEIVRIAVARSPGRHRRQGQARRWATAPAGYLDPLRGVSGLTPERIDEGVDFAGSGPVYPIGDAVITHAASGYSTGWPGGGWITYRLTNGLDAGLTIYLAEDVTPAVRAGQHVSTSTVIGNMFAGADGIETGWAQPNGLLPESELPAAGGIGGNGPFPTRVGVNFEQLLQSLGVPAAPGGAQPAFGLLPANYPAP